MVPATDPDQQPQACHAQKIKTRALLLGDYPDPMNMLGALALAPTPYLPGQARPHTPEKGSGLTSS